MHQLSLESIVILSTLLTSVNSNFLVSRVLSTLLNDNHLSACEVLFVTINKGELNKTSNAATHISSVLLPNYNPFETTSGTFTLGISYNSNKTKTIKYQRLKDIHRFNKKHCGVAVFYISQISTGLTLWLFETIIPRYVPIIRKDEDHFIFMFDREVDATKILISQDFGQRIRLKIGIVPHSSVLQDFKITEPGNSLNSEAVLKQVDLYAENGECRANALQISTIPSAKVLFLDSNNFNGKRLQVVIPKAPSYFEMKSKGNGVYHPVRGLYKVWLDVMIERFNFSIHLTLSSASGSTGKRLKNGTWVGSVGDILARRADMAAFNGHIYNRHEYVDWSAPLTYEWMVFITHKPKSFFSPSAIYRPFPIILWIGFLISVFLICIVLKVISNFAFPANIPLDFRGMIMFIFSSFMEQDAQFYLELLFLHSVRVLIAFWFLFAMIISTAYKGKLVSLIAFPEVTWVPTSFDQLAYSDYRVGLNVFGKGGATYSVLSTSKSPVYQEFFRRMELYPDPVNCLKAAFNYDLGCLMVKSVADFNAAKNFTDKFGRNPFRASEQTALFREDGYVCSQINYAP